MNHTDICGNAVSSRLVVMMQQWLSGLRYQIVFCNSQNIYTRLMCDCGNPTFSRLACHQPRAPSLSTTSRPAAVSSRNTAAFWRPTAVGVLAFKVRDVPETRSESVAGSLLSEFRIPSGVSGAPRLILQYQIPARGATSAPRCTKHVIRNMMT